MIEIKNLYKHYDVKGQQVAALHDINLSIPAGEIFGIIGASGAGKSTLIRCMNLLETPSAGQVWVDGIELTAISQQQLRQVRRNIGMIFQHFNLLSTKTVAQNIALPLQLMKVSPTKITQRINELLTLVGLEDKAHRYPNQLSGGQKQRVAIARALASEPKILLCDEATSALDPQTTAAILQLLRNINQRLGLTIALITHEMDVIKQICHRVALLEKGKIIEQSDTTQFFIQPQTLTSRAVVATHLRHQEIVPIAERQLLRLSFRGAIVQQPIIAQLVKECDVELNILQATVEYINQQQVGILVVDLPAQADKLRALQNFLHGRGVQVDEVIDVA
ncbi:MAG: methionine ABC transporter ATP-binding protein [Gammaproteobacteria bacterium]